VRRSCVLTAAFLQALGDLRQWRSEERNEQEDKCEIVTGVV